MQKFDEKPLLTVQQAAKRLAMTKVTIYQLIRTGDLRAVRIPQRNKDGKISRYTVRFTDALINDFITRHGGY